MSETEISPDVFESASNPRPLASKKIFSDGLDWDSLRDSGIRPRFVSDYVEDESGRQEFLSGVRDLKLTKLPPQSLTIADVLNRGDETTVICVPRRSSKTTSVFATLLGRMGNRERYMIGFTAQTQVKARKRIIEDVIQPLQRQWDKTDDACPYTWGIAPGNTYVRVKATGSQITALPPTEDAARGDAYSAFAIDEAQEVDKATGEMLLSAILPTFDTIDGGGQLILMGTAGESKTGLLWTELELGRKGDNAIVEYASDPETVRAYDPEEDGDDTAGTTADEAVWRAAHPGIDTLTTIDVLRRRFTKLGPAKFAREYLGIWPDGAGDRLLPVLDWEACRYEDLPELPDNWVLAVAVHPMDAWASIVAFWRDERGLGHMGVLDARAGSTWVERELRTIYTKHRKPVVYDAGTPSCKNLMDRLNAGGRVRVQPQQFLQKASAAVLMVREVKGHRVRHYSQPAMDNAAEHAVKRNAADRWLFGRDDYDADITALEAASLAMRVWDEKPPNKKQKHNFASYVAT